MPLPATSEVDSAADEKAVNDLLGGAGNDEESSAATETETEEPEQTETTEAEESSEETAAEETEEASDEEAETESDEEKAEEEGELSIDESDRDYSTAAYEKAAKHYSRTHGVQLNPEDPAHRALLKEVMDRGEALKRQKADSEAEEAEADDGKKADEAEAVAQPQKPTAEQIQAHLSTIGEIAKQRIVPEVAAHVANRFVNALWPGKNIKLSQEQANDVTSALHEFFMLAMDDAAPAVFGMVNQQLDSDPAWGPVKTEAIRANAFEHLDGLKDATGKPQFPDLEKMVESGTLRNVMKANPWITQIKSGNGKDPVKNYAEQVKAAYKIARGEQTVEQVKTAVQTGKKQATDNAKKIAASRVAPGKPKGGFSQPVGDGQKLINDITSGAGSGSKFGAAVRSQLKK